MTIEAMLVRLKNIRYFLEQYKVEGINTSHALSALTDLTEELEALL